jgi:hypothetical protein
MNDTSQPEWQSSTGTAAADAADGGNDGGSETAQAGAGSTAEASSDEEEPSRISKDTQFGMLKNRRRRDILRYLRENDGESTLSDLAEFIAAKENGVERRLLSSDERKRVYIGLYQCHLPKMDDARVVDFDKRSGDVSLRPEADQLFTYIDHDGDGDDATDESDAGEPARPLNSTVKLGLGWSLCLVAVLSAVGISVLPPVGLLGGVIAVTFAATETVDALPSLLAGRTAAGDD